MRLAIVGRGRLGRSLEALARQAGIDVTLFGREPVADGPWDAVLLAVPDRAIAQVAAGLRVPSPVLHTSGATDLTPVAHHAEHGSFHPLMTFPGPEVALPDLAGVPAAIDGTPGARAAAWALADRLGMRPFTVPGDRRLYHAAAVIAGNLATVLLGTAAEVLTAAGVPAADAPGLLAPLALTSLRNAAVDPRAALTGPIARGDEAVIAGHRAALAEAGLGALVPWYDGMVARTRALKEG